MFFPALPFRITAASQITRLVIDLLIAQFLCAALGCEAPTSRRFSSDLAPSALPVQAHPTNRSYLFKTWALETPTLTSD